jgi:hypothetical protein
MSRLFAKLKVQDSEYRSRAVTLHAHDKTIITPKRAFNLGASNSESRVIKNESIRGINEVARILDENLLNELNNDKNKMLNFTKELRSRFSHIDLENETSFFLFFYDSGGKLPLPKHIDLLANLVSGNHYNDIIVPPIMRGLSGEDYVKYLESFMDSLETYVRNPQIMGSIPHVAHIELSDICNFYMKKGVTVFALDVDGKNPLDMYPNINEVYRIMGNIEHELSGEECCYLHGVNIRKPRGLSKKGFAPARDILVFEMGFDSFGTTHFKPTFGKEDWKRALSSDVAWVLSRRDYAYYPTSSQNIHLIHEETNPTVSLNDVLSSSRKRDKARMFNAERQGVEAKEVQTRLHENDLPEYLKTKAAVDDSLKQIKAKLPIQP